IITDISMPDMNGIEAIRELKRSSPGVRVVVLTMHSSPVHVTGALEAGANGYVLKSAPPSELSAAIRTVLNGGRYLSPSFETHFGGSLAASDGVRALVILSPRERQVLQLL